MPIYDFFCNCGECKLDEMVKDFKEVVTCDSCGKKMERAISAPKLAGFDKAGRSGMNKKQKA
jgi:putative FmdB family regulatory protein